MKVKLQYWYKSLVEIFHFDNYFAQVSWYFCNFLFEDIHNCFVCRHWIRHDLSASCGLRWLLLWDQAIAGHGTGRLRLRLWYLRVRSPCHHPTGAIWLEGRQYDSRRAHSQLCREFSLCSCCSLRCVLFIHTCLPRAQANLSTTIKSVLTGAAMYCWLKSKL